MISYSHDVQEHRRRIVAGMDNLDTFSTRTVRREVQKYRYKFNFLHRNRAIGQGEVVSSILTGSTRLIKKWAQSHRSLRIRFSVRQSLRLVDKPTYPLLVVREAKPSLCHCEQTYLALDLGGFPRESEQVEGVSSKTRTHGTTRSTALPHKSRRFVKCSEKSDRFRDGTHNRTWSPSAEIRARPFAGP